MEKTKKKRVMGRTIVDSRRRVRYDEGGRNPLTAVKMVPVSVVVEFSLWQKLEKLSEAFINPSTKKPYGLSALGRILVTLGIDRIDRLKREDLLYYIPNDRKGSTGRFAISEDQPLKLSLAINKDHIDRINEHLKQFESAVIGTTTYIRLFLREGLDKIKAPDLVQYMPQKHKDQMLREGLTMEALKRQYLRSLKL